MRIEKGSECRVQKSECRVSRQIECMQKAECGREESKALSVFKKRRVQGAEYGLNLVLCEHSLVKCVYDFRVV